MSKLTQKAEINEKITRKVENELARLKIRVEEKDRYIDKLKLEYDRVFAELKACKKDKYDDNSSPIATDNQQNSTAKVSVD